MPKAQLHWVHDLLVAVLVGAIGGLVFWFVPPAVAAVVHLTEIPACNAAIS
jgi:hypothetical protein